MSTADGTGIVHTEENPQYGFPLGPASGAEDMVVGDQHRLPVPQTVDGEGRFIAAVTPWQGVFAKGANPLITRQNLFCRYGESSGADGAAVWLGIERV